MQQGPYLEEGVRQRQMPYAAHFGILSKLLIHIEEDWHVNLLTRPQPLLLKTEALDLVEILPSLLRRHIVCGDTCHGFVAGVVRRVEGKCALTWRYLHSQHPFLQSEATSQMR